MISAAPISNKTQNENNSTGDLISQNCGRKTVIPIGSAAP